MGRRARRGRGAGRRREGGGRGPRGEGRCRPCPAPPPAGVRGLAWRGRGHEHAGRAMLYSGPRAAAACREHCRPSTSAEDLRTFSRTRSSTHLWALPVGVQQAPRRSAVAPELLSTTLCQRLQSASFAGRPTLHKSPRGPPPPSSVPKMPNPSPYSVGSVSPEDPTSFYSCWLLLLVQEASFFY